MSGPGPGESDRTVVALEPPAVVTDLEPPPPDPRVRRAVFALEGRATPGLYVLGWIATAIGVALMLVAGAAGVVEAARLGLTIGAALFLGIGLIAAAGAQGAQRRVDGVPGYDGPSPFLVFGATLPVTILLVLVVVVVFVRSLAGIDGDSPLASLIGVALTAIVYIGLVRLLIVGPRALTWGEMGVLRLPLVRIAGDAVSGAVYAAPVVAVTYVLAIALILLFGTAPESPLPPSGTTQGLLVNLVAAAILAPIGEELFFRGFALTAWARSMPVRAALVRSAIFFAFVHIITIGAATFSEGAAQAVIAFASRVPVALALGWIFLRRGSLYAAIGLHAAFNAILLVLAFFAPRA